VADGKLTRHRYATKHVQLTPDRRSLTWDSGKKLLDLSTVLRVSVGLESRTLQKLYSSSAGAEAELAPYHWFSLHTATRSFDFGVKEAGYENEWLLRWVLTLQQLVAQHLPPANVAAACCALTQAQTQWQRFASQSKEWPCFVCTVVNRPERGGACGTCGSARPLVTLCPCLMPLLQTLQALGRTLGVNAFDGRNHDGHLLWFLMRVLETPLPPPFVWSLRHKGDASQPYLGVASEDGSVFNVDHMHLVEQQELAHKLRHQIAAAGGSYTPAPLQTAFVAPAESSRDSVSPGSEASSAPDTSRSDADGTFRMPEGLSQRDFEEALAAAASYDQQRQQSQQQPELGVPTPPGVEHQGSLAERSIADMHLDPADVFRHCMSGAVVEVRRFLEQGGHADTVYKEDYGWDVGPDWLFTKPNDGTTVLNYVATWTDVIGEKAPELVALLLRHGADLLRDDGLDQWFTPLHNAVANGAKDVIEVILSAKPDMVNLTTGDGRTPLHVLALCDDPADRMASLMLLIRYSGALAAAEPFEGNTPLHVMAREGHSEVCIRLLEAGAPKGAVNDASRTPLQEAQHALSTLEQEGNPNTVTRRSKLSETIANMEIAVLAID